MAESLIPPSIRDERSLAVEGLLARLDTLPVAEVIGALYDPAACPEAALPALAHQFGILDEGWMLAGTTAARRVLLAHALPLQALRGTPWGLKQALSAIGWPGVTLQERTNHWAHFRVQQPLLGRALTAVDLTRIKAVIEAWKPTRCVLDGLTLGVSFASSMPGAGPRYDGAYTYNGAINHNSLVLATIAYVQVGNGTPTLRIDALTITESAGKKVITFAIDAATGNGLTLNAYAVYTAAGILVASATTVDVLKTSEISLAVEWTLNVI